MKMLAVRTGRTDYVSYCKVTYAASFEDAKEQLAYGEKTGQPFDAMDLPVDDRESFWAFLNWMRATGRNYSFSVYGDLATPAFWALREECRSKGFHFNT